MLPETAAERCEWLLKLAVIPPQLAAAGDLRAAFWGSGFSASLTSADFLLWALTLLWPPEAPCAAVLGAGREQVCVPGPLTRGAGPGWATQEPRLPRAQRLRRAGDLASPGSRGTNIWCAVLLSQGQFLLLRGSPPGADFAPTRADFDEDAGNSGQAWLSALEVFPRMQPSRSLSLEPCPLELSF